MTRTVVVAPHPDDETLFAGYLVQREQADVVVALWCGEERMREASRAVDCLRPGWREEPWHDDLDTPFTQWHFPQEQPDWPAVGRALDALAARYDRAVVPAVELTAGAHEHHNLVGDLALHAFGPERVTRYLTYDRLAGRSTGGARVEPEGAWVLRKLVAMTCHRSQILDPGCRPHFERGLDEYVLP